MTNNHQTISVRHLKACMKRLHVTDNDVLAIKKDSVLATEEGTESMRRALASMGINVLTVIVEDFSEIAALNETTMRKHGWYRFPLNTKRTNTK